MRDSAHGRYTHSDRFEGAPAHSTQILRPGQAAGGDAYSVAYFRNLDRTALLAGIGSLHLVIQFHGDQLLKRVPRDHADELAAVEERRRRSVQPEGPRFGHILRDL